MKNSEKKTTKGDWPKGEIQGRVIEELGQAFESAKETIEEITSVQDFSKEVFGKEHRMANYLKKGARWSDPGLIGLAQINKWLIYYNISPVDVNYVFTGERDPYKKILDKIQAENKGVSVF